MQDIASNDQNVVYNAFFWNICGCFVVLVNVL